jgi:GH24 family phage-related lysozyme (muramidase)
MAEDIVDFIARKEGFSSQPYWDVRQWSIGHGSYAGSTDRANPPNISVNREQARAMLIEQMQPFVANVNKYDTRYNWTPNERDALTSFAYNIGSIDQLTANGTRTKAEIAQKMLEYNKAGGQVLDGLVDRRREEQAIFLGGRNLETADLSEDPLDAFGGAGEDVDAVPGGEPGPAAGACRSNYLQNRLNTFDTYTYKWTLYIVHPLKAHLDPAELTEGNDSIIISQTGVDDEVSIESVVQDLFLSFSKGNRNAQANNFAVTFVEPGGFTMFNRIVFAAQQLDIENHLDACYILKLEFTGWENDTPTTVPAKPFFYTTRLLGLTFDFKDGASTYYGNFVETKEDAFNRLELHLKQDTIVDGVSTFGEFLERFQEEHNRELELQLHRNQGQVERDRYIFNTNEEWAGWAFDQVTPDALTETRGISVSGDGTLKFTFPQGTAVNSAIATAIFQTEKFKKVLTDKGGFIKESPDDGQADPVKLADLVKWIKVNTDVKYYMYDMIAKRYAKEITYTTDGILAPEAVHDPNSFVELHKQRQTQRDRLRNIFDNGLLKKRYDYTFTGMNTEVLDLDVKLDSAYYAVQALNSGALRGTTDHFTGSSTEGQTLTNDLKRESTKIEQDIKQLKRDIETLRKERDEVDAFGDPEVVRKEYQARIDEKTQQIKRLTSRVSSNQEAYQAALEQQRKGYSGRSERIPSASQKYITQSDLYRGNSALGGRESLPQKFEYLPINSLSTAGPEKKNDDIGSSMLGAMELNLNSIADLMQQQIFVRGDPYWLGQNGGAEYETGGVFYFLNLNFPTYPEESTGLIGSISSREQEGQFTITGLYRVLQVQARYDGGQFTMLLKSFRDTNTNSNLLYEDLMRGCVEGGSVRNLPDRTQSNNETDQGGSNQDDTVEGDGGNSNINPANGNDFSGNHSFGAGLDSNLQNIMSAAAAETGVTIGTRSGVRPFNPATQQDSAGSTSGRHTYGNAIDAELFMNGRKLSVSNPADRAIIAQFSQSFYNNARNAGFNPSIGWADHTAPRSEWYMGGDAGHFDIASGRNTRPQDDSFIQAGYWGNGSRSSGAPAWLRNIFG